MGRPRINSKYEAAEALLRYMDTRHSMLSLQARKAIRGLQRRSDFGNGQYYGLSFFSAKQDPMDTSCVEVSPMPSPMLLELGNLAVMSYETTFVRGNNKVSSPAECCACFGFSPLPALPDSQAEQAEDVSYKTSLGVSHS